MKQEFDEQVIAASGMIGESTNMAIAIITAAIARHTNITSALIADLQQAHHALNSHKQSLAPAALAQGTLQVVIELLNTEKTKTR